MPIKFLVLGGGSCFFGRGGVEVPILFLWAWGFNQQFSRQILGDAQYVLCAGSSVGFILCKEGSTGPGAEPQRFCRILEGGLGARPVFFCI